MRRCGKVLAALMVAVGAGCGPAPLAKNGNIAVLDAHAFPSIEGSMAVFVTVANRGSGADTVVGFETSVAGHVMLHRNDAVGEMMQMVHQAELVLPPESVTEMRSGELHLMLEGLGREMVPGDSLRITLLLSRERTLEVAVLVRGFGE